MRVGSPELPRRPAAVALVLTTACDRPSELPEHGPVIKASAPPWISSSP